MAHAVPLSGVDHIHGRVAEVGPLGHRSKKWGGGNLRVRLDLNLLAFRYVTGAGLNWTLNATSKRKEKVRNEAVSGLKAACLEQIGGCLNTAKCDMSNSACILSRSISKRSLGSWSDSQSEPYLMLVPEIERPVQTPESIRSCFEIHLRSGTRSNLEILRPTRSSRKTR